MTSKKRSQEKQRRERLLAELDRQPGRPYDNVDYVIAPEYENPNAKPPLSAKKVIFWSSVIMLCLLVVGSALWLSLPSPERVTESAPYVDAKPTGSAVGAALLRKTGKVSSISTTQDDYPNRINFRRAKLVSDHYLCFGSCQERFLLPFWMSLAIAQDTFLSANIVEVEYLGAPLKQQYGLGNAVSYRVTGVSVDGVRQTVPLWFKTMVAVFGCFIVAAVAFTAGMIWKFLKRNSAAAG